ncbi:MAG: DNA polymerase III subunit gamma/tau [Chloroflexota bacterium]|nr:DNA polymerase III subunit gamma/tau [Chloroflexota bacterium]
MAGQVLYRKWRPQTFEEMVGQEHVVQTLRNALAADDVAHAYLFAGPRGTGKTTTARLLAKAVNCLSQDAERPCNQCAICQAINDGQCMDLIEVDAASNRGIDEIRDLRSKVNFSPSRARYKVYILDEAHMLTNPAFNALLKTLEEPPSHVIFVLVTTEPHKLPATITSRCQRFDFHRLSLPDIVGELEHIAELERATVQPKALELIARSATGSLRDAISLLDQVMTAGGQNVTLEGVRRTLGMARMSAAAELVSTLVEGDISSGLQLINKVIHEGADPRQFSAQVVDYLHGMMLWKVGEMEPPLPAELAAKLRKQADKLVTPQILRMLRLFNRASREMGGGPQPQLPLELALLEAVFTFTRSPVPDQVQAGAGKARQAAEPARVERKVIRETKPEMAEEASSPAPAPSQAGEIGLADVRAAWPRILEQVRERSVSTEALLKDCEPVSVEDGRITLSFRYAFHRDKVREQPSKGMVEEAIGSVLGEVRPIRCVPASSAPSPAEEPRPEGHPALGKDELEAAINDPVVKAMVDRYGAQVVNVEQIEG